MKRRGFLTQTAAAFAALGLGELGLEKLGAEQLGARWQALAAAEGRCFALSIGINRYDSAGRNGIESLSGCVRDVELLQRLLQFRFGFAPEQMTTLLDDAATGDRIDAELQKLAGQLAPSDSLVLHFSGYGTQIVQPAAPTTGGEVEAEAEETIARKSAIVAADGRPYLLTDLNERLAALPTRNAIAIVDASYALPASSCRQEVRLRAIEASQTDRQSPIGATQTGVIKRRELGDRRPAMITYDCDGLAAERRWSDFTAGVLTYTLTQALWHLGMTANWSDALTMALLDVERMSGAPLLLKSQRSTNRQGKEVEVNLRPSVPASTVGAIVAVNAERPGSAEVWLGGLKASVLSSYRAGSILTGDRQVLERPPTSVLPIPKPPNDDAGETEPASESREGSEANTASTVSKTTVASPRSALRSASPVLPAEDRNSWLRVDRARGLQRTALSLVANRPENKPENAAGRPLFEVVRVLPRSIQLGVALDTQLPRIERVDATSALSGLRGVEAISSNDREADCWFGCARNCDLPTELEETEVAEARKRYTLLSFDRQPIFDCALESDLAIKRTIRNLEPRLQDLRAFKILSATENSTASMLKVRVTYGVANTDPTLPDRGLRRVAQTTAIAASTAPRDRSTLELDAGSRLQYRIENLGDLPLYFLLVRLDPCGRLSVPDTDERIIRPRDVLAVPDRPETTAWNVEREPGLVRLFAILSDRPFAQTRKTLTQNHATGSRDLAREPVDVDLSGEVAEAIVADLDAASRKHLPDLDFGADSYALDVRRWATLSLAYRIV